MAVDATRIDWSKVPRQREHRQLGTRPRWFNGAPVTSVAFDSRGRHLVTASDRFLRLFWAATGELVHTFEGPGNEGTTYDRVGFSPDARQVLAHIGPAREGSGALGVWDVESGMLERRIETPGIGRISAHDPFRARVLARDRNAGALLLDAEDGSSRLLEPRPDGGLGGAAFVSPTRVVGMASMDGDVRCWDTVSGAVVWERRIHGLSSAAASPREPPNAIQSASRGDAAA
jgi:WD40 repeat protein